LRISNASSGCRIMFANWSKLMNHELRIKKATLQPRINSTGMDMSTDRLTADYARWIALHCGDKMIHLRRRTMKKHEITAQLNGRNLRLKSRNQPRVNK